MDITDAPRIEKTMRTGYYSYGLWNNPPVDEPETEGDEFDDE